MAVDLSKTPRMTVREDGSIGLDADSQARLDAGRAYEAARRPLALKVTGQYDRGLITLWELIEALTEVDLEVTHATSAALGRDY